MASSGSPKTVADNVTAAMQPIAGWSNRHNNGGRPVGAKTSTNQLGDTGANRDTWMVDSRLRCRPRCGSARSATTNRW